MSNIAIKVEHLTKEYQIGQTKSGDLRESFGNKLGALFNPKQNTETFTALDDISFEIKKGEVVGIIGRNGAGKSTLLKILSRITEPTKGRFEINGRVSSLLEVGTGFHPELSGRENIYLNGTILGMKRAEIKTKFDEIISFSGVEKFIDTPVKHYSSGMKVRLAFSVAAHLEPEILIIDEVLAVGDAEFQKKCLGKMDDVSKNEGRTVVFVSHNMSAVKDLCQTGLVLNEGKSTLKMPINNAVKRYTGFLNKIVAIKKEWLNGGNPKNESIRIISMEVISMNSETEYTTDSDILLTFVFKNLIDSKSQLDITFHLINEDGVLVFVGSTAHTLNINFASSVITAMCKIPKNLLNEGTYTISRLLFVKDKGSLLLESNDNLTFKIDKSIKSSLGWRGKKEGIIKPLLDWTMTSI